MQQWAVVVNPVKVGDLAQARAAVEATCSAAGWPPPRWYETTVEDPGTGQARQAVDDGASLVCAWGGDGTVRAVAAGLLSTGTPLGLLPAGTGNLLARNLKLPVDDADAALRTALTGSDRAIDVGLISFDGDPDEPFLVMAGMGLDADAMAGASSALKRRIGWLAYAWSGLTALVKVGFGVRVVAGGERVATQHAATVIVGNCGEITGGLQLMPQAVVDDGLLDAVVASPRSLTGWVSVGVYVLSRRRFGHGSLVSLTGERIQVTAREPVEAQLDGENVGPKRRLDCRVLAGGLLVRVAGDTSTDGDFT